MNGEAVLERLLRRVDEAVYEAVSGQPGYVSQGSSKGALTTAGEFQMSPAAIREEAAWALAHPGRVRRANEGGEDNGFILWNFLVGDARLRRTHQAELATISREWRDILRNRANVRVKIIGSASPSGVGADNQALSLRRAQSVHDFMTRHGIDRSRLDVEGVGISQPLSDNRLAEDMARHRRVDAFLYVPTNIMRPTAAIRRNVLNWVPTFSSLAILEIDLQNSTFAERLGAIRVTAQVRLSGTPPGSIVGFLQFLTQDSRLGIYRSRDGSRTVTLDYRRCVAPFLPARDVLDGASPLSVVRLGASSGPTTDVVEIGFADSPGVSFPLVHTVPGGATLLLAQTIWSMQFVLFIGVRIDRVFIPIQHVVWTLNSRRTLNLDGLANLMTARRVSAGPRIPSGRDIPTQTQDGRPTVAGIPIVTGLAEGPGIPHGLNIVNIPRAMAGRTARFLTRVIDRSMSPGVCTPSIS